MSTSQTNIALPEHDQVRLNRDQHSLAVYDPFVNSEEAADSIDLRAIWNTLVKYKWTILVFMMFVVLTVSLANFLMRPVYRDTTTIEYALDAKLVKLENVENSPQSRYREVAETQQNIIRSESLAIAVIDRLGIWNHPELTREVTQRGVLNGLSRIQALLFGTEGLLQKWFPQESNDIREVDSVENKRVARQQIIIEFLERLSVNNIRNSFLFSISYESFYKSTAADITNAVVEEYKQLNTTRRLDSTAGAREFLEGQIAQVQGKLETSEKELTGFARKHEIVDLENRDNILNERLAELSTQLTQVESERINAETLFNQASQGNIDSIPAVLERSLIDELKNELVALESEYLELTQVFKDSYPKVKQIKSKLAQVQRSLDRETGKVVRSLELQYKQLLEKESLISGALEKQKRELLDIKDRSIQYNILKREWETNRELYAGLLEKMKEVGVSAGIERNNVSVVDYASIPVKPAAPKTGRNIAIAVLVGLLGGICIALLLGYLDNTYRSSEEMETALRTPSLGLSPNISRKEKDDRQNVGTISHTDLNHEISESIRNIRTSLMFSSSSGAPKIILVTSSTAEEGKSTFSSNLAIAFAQSGLNVLLINGDLRRPVIHHIFNAPVTPGVSDYLVGAVSEPPIQSTHIDGLSILTAGTSSPNPTELIGSRRTADVIKELSERFDHIIIESPPILGIPDALVWSSYVNGVILLVASGTTSKDAVKDAVKRLRIVNAPLAGTVLNMVDTKSQEYGYYNQYYYSETNT
ncbi:MAG: polysaccharide biosynthesis tyrosine autokinase [Gammaproteobacteria bacterium]|nr:polysaccharide biosynthesis tyrosine autokinase [Gammaproteobacteria bacterium]